MTGGTGCAPHSAAVGPNRRPSGRGLEPKPTAEVQASLASTAPGGGVGRKSLYRAYDCRARREETRAGSCIRPSSGPGKRWVVASAPVSAKESAIDVEANEYRCDQPEVYLSSAVVSRAPHTRRVAVGVYAGGRSCRARRLESFMCVMPVSWGQRAPSPTHNSGYKSSRITLRGIKSGTPCYCGNNPGTAFHVRRSPKTVNATRHCSAGAKPSFQRAKFESTDFAVQGSTCPCRSLAARRDAVQAGGTAGSRST